MLRAGFNEALVKGPKIIIKVNRVNPTTAELALDPSPGKGVRMTMESANVPAASKMVPVHGGIDGASNVEPRYIDAKDEGRKRLRVIPPKMAPRI
jgi:hypothetical protein